MSPAWMDAAACKGHDPDDWFPHQGENRRLETAKAICRTCPVRPDCLQWALDHREMDGVWGGTSGLERARMLGLQIKPSGYQQRQARQEREAV